MTIDELARASNTLTEYTREEMANGLVFPVEWHEKMAWVQHYIASEIGDKNIEVAYLTTSGLEIILKPPK